MDSELPRLVCLGNLTVDDVYLPDGSVTPNCMGGNALYATLGARLWEPAVQMVAPLTPDIPQTTLEAMRLAGFNPECQPHRAGRAMHNRIYYDAEGGRRWENSTTWEEFDALSPRPSDIPASYRGAKAFLVLAMSIAAQEEIVSWLREHTNALIALDTQEDYVLGNEEQLQRLLSRVDICMPSAIEVIRLLKHDDLPAAARQLAESGPPVVVIKNGENGALVYDRAAGDWFVQPAQAGPVIDTTGAGDAFCGGFLAAYVRSENGGDLRAAARAGSISASYAVASFGMAALLQAGPEDVRGAL